MGVFPTLWVVWDPWLRGLSRHQVELPIKDGPQLQRVKKALLDKHYTNVTYIGWADKFWQRLSCPVYLDASEIAACALARAATQAHGRLFVAVQNLHHVALSLGFLYKIYAPQPGPAVRRYADIALVLIAEDNAELENKAEAAPAEAEGSPKL